MHSGALHTPRNLPPPRAERCRTKRQRYTAKPTAEAPAENQSERRARGKFQPQVKSILSIPASPPLVLLLSTRAHLLRNVTGARGMTRPVYQPHTTSVIFLDDSEELRLQPNFANSSGNVSGLESNLTPRKGQSADNPWQRHGSTPPKEPRPVGAPSPFGSIPKSASSWGALTATVIRDEGKLRFFNKDWRWRRSFRIAAKMAHLSGLPRPISPWT
jgi:hypothetical protein